MILLKNNKILILGILFIVFFKINAQTIQLYDQINGRFDYTFVGNTLNKQENGTNGPCEILTSSTARLFLYPNERVTKAYLYWAGSGPGDFEIKINEIDLVAERQFFNTQNVSNLEFFSGFANVTNIVQEAVNAGRYDFTISELDLSEHISRYCPNATNFGGWAILVVYESDNLPLNQLNIYDGLEGVPNDITIDLGVLNVIDNTNSSIGFIAWEGDRNIAVNETLRFNGNILSRPPLNPANNAFNGTNSITGSVNLFNMDLDIYFLDQYLSIGAQSANVSLTSGQDFVLINTVVTKLNSQLPDASILFSDIENQCNSRVVKLQYSITNFNATQYLPAETKYRIYADNVLIFEDVLGRNILIGHQIDYTQTINLPDSIPDNFTLKIVVDENELIPEINENNNIYTQQFFLNISTEIPDFTPIQLCNIGFNTAVLNTTPIFDRFTDLNITSTTLHYNYDDANLDVNRIVNENIEIVGRENSLFVRFVNLNGCVTIKAVPIKIKNCLPTVYNAISNNQDGMNDSLIIEGLQNIFENYYLEIYNRWGQKIWTGKNNVPLWNGEVKNDKAPAGTYYYILYLNDPDYKNPLQGYLYLTY